MHSSMVATIGIKNMQEIRNMRHQLCLFASICHLKKERECDETEARDNYKRFWTWAVRNVINHSGFAAPSLARNKMHDTINIRLNEILQSYKKENMSQLLKDFYKAATEYSGPGTIAQPFYQNGVYFHLYN